MDRPVTLQEPEAVQLPEAVHHRQLLDIDCNPTVGGSIHSHNLDIDRTPIGFPTCSNSTVFPTRSNRLDSDRLVPTRPYRLLGLRRASSAPPAPAGAGFEPATCGVFRAMVKSRWRRRWRWRKRLPPPDGRRWRWVLEVAVAMSKSYLWDLTTSVLLQHLP